MVETQSIYNNNIDEDLSVIMMTQEQKTVNKHTLVFGIILYKHHL